ncbi:MAG: sodium:proton antiporter [Methanobacterium sp.]|nr:sodium:proton antiporter [Methanobacterium sp.]
MSLILNSFIYIVSAFGLGALHAFEPGHGKSVMAAFVMGTNAKLRDAWVLGLIVVFSHVLVVLLLGVASIFLLGALDTYTAQHFMGLVGGSLLILVGIWILRRYKHQHPHEHEIDTGKGVVAIGLSTGLIPCPAALGVLMFSIANNQLYDGIVYVLIFSAGLAISITLLSVLFVKGKGFLKRYINNKTVNKIPLLSGTLIILIGIYTLLGYLP